VQAVGGAISGLAAGEVTDHFGYSVSFLSLAGVAALGWALFLLKMPETRDGEANAWGAASSA
jgi:predicted MFS family arabinose efflux permease